MIDYNNIYDHPIKKNIISTVTEPDYAERRKTPNTNNILAKEIKKTANQYSNSSDTELSILQEFVESKLKEIESQIKLLETKKPDSPKLPLFKERLKELKAEYNQIMKEINSRQEQGKKPKLNTRG